MSLIDYIKGNRKGKEANRIERDALGDSFLFDAIEGYDSIDDNHVQRIARLQKQIRSRSKCSAGSKGISPVWKVAAAVVLLVFGFGGYLFVDDRRSNMAAEEAPIRLIDIYVPEEIYTQYAGKISEKNIAAKNVLKAYIEPFKVEEDVKAVITQEERDMLAEPKRSVITIYIPDMVYEQHQSTIVTENFTNELIASPADSTSVIQIYVPKKDFERYKLN